MAFPVDEPTVVWANDAFSGMAPYLYFTDSNVVVNNKNKTSESYSYLPLAVIVDTDRGPVVTMCPTEAAVEDAARAIREMFKPHQLLSDIFAVDFVRCATTPPRITTS